GVHQLRYWDGLIWTEHVSDNGTQATDPLPESSTGINKKAEKEAHRETARAAKEKERAAARRLKDEAKDAARKAEDDPSEHKSVDGTARLTDTHLVFE